MSAASRIAHDVTGTGPAVLFLHAFPLHRGMWDAQVRALAATHQVVRFDARGFGGTPPGDGLLTMERIADDAITVLDQLGLSRATVISTIPRALSMMGPNASIAST